MLQSPVRACAYPHSPLQTQVQGVTRARAQGSRARGFRGVERKEWGARQVGDDSEVGMATGRNGGSRRSKGWEEGKNPFPSVTPACIFLSSCPVSLKTCSPATSLDGGQSEDRNSEGEDCGSHLGSRCPGRGSQFSTGGSLGS